MKDVRKHNTLPMGICGAILLLVLAVGCQGTTPLVTHTVYFAVNSRHGTLKAEMNGKSISSGAQAVKDQTVMLTAEPNAGYEIGTWSIAGGTKLSGGKSGERTVRVKLTSDITVKVEFKTKSENLQPQPKYSGTFGIDGGKGTLKAVLDGSVLTSPVQVEKGKKIIFTAEPAAGYMVQSWNGLSAANQNATNVEYTVTGNFNITVRFKPVPAEKYTVTIQPLVNGTVSVNPALPPDKKIGKDTELIFTAEPNEGYETGAWTVTGGTKLSGGNNGDKSVKVKVTSDITVKVEFKKKPENPAPQPPVNPGQEPEHIPVTEVILHDLNDNPIPETIVINVGEQYRLKPVIKPENATDKKVRYEHGNGVSITEDGLVTGKKKGAETVNVWVDGKKHVSAGFQIKSDSTIDFDKTEIKTDYNTDSAAAVITKKSANSIYHCTLRYAGGKGNWVNWTKVSNGFKDTITVNIEENKSAFERRAYLVFKSDNTNRAKLIREIPIIQKAHPKPVLRTEWVHGITPPSGTELEYGGHNVNPKYGVWKETQTTTWFNSKKSQDKTDDQMCWAMSIADLLHWWMKENEDNLKTLTKKRGIKSDTEEYKLYLGEYDRSLPERKSSVANVFRKRFKNSLHGTALNSAAGWYLLGMTAGGELTPEHSAEPAPGIVKGIFSDLNELIKPSYAHDKQEFEKTIKAALDEQNAFAVQFILGKAGLHVVTVWGVEFDADDNITALWVSDSNDGNSQLTKFGVHYPNGLPHKINYAVANDKGETLITDVITMKNAKQQFKNWLDNNP